MGSRGSEFIDDNFAKNLLSTIEKYEKELEASEAGHAEKRKQNGPGWYESFIKPENPENVRITRGSKEKGNYEVKEISRSELEDYVSVIKPAKISSDKLLSAAKNVKDVLSKEKYEYSPEFANNLRLLGMAVNRYRGLDFVNLYSLTSGSAFSISGESRREIQKIEEVLGIKLL